VNLQGLRRTHGALDLERALGLDLEPWLIRFAEKLKHKRKCGQWGVEISYQDRLALAACMAHEYLRPSLWRVERELQLFNRVTVKERNGQTSEIQKF
jgi:hypothetical protein